MTESPSIDADLQPVLTVSGHQPLGRWPRLALYLGITSVWLGAHLAYPLLSELLWRDGTDLMDADLPRTEMTVDCVAVTLFSAIVLAYQYLLELAMRYVRRPILRGLLAMALPAIGAYGFLMAIIAFPLGNENFTNMDVGEGMVLSLFAIPAYYILGSPMIAAFVPLNYYLITRFAPVPAPPPKEDFDAY